MCTPREEVVRGRPLEERLEDALLRALQMKTLSREEWWGLLSIKPLKREISYRESLSTKV